MTRQEIVDRINAMTPDEQGLCYCQINKMEWPDAFVDIKPKPEMTSNEVYNSPLAEIIWNVLGEIMSPKALSWAWWKYVLSKQQAEHELWWKEYGTYDPQRLSAQSFTCDQ